MIEGFELLFLQSHASNVPGKRSKTTRSEKVEVGLTFDFHDEKETQVHPRLG